MRKKNPYGLRELFENLDFHDDFRKGVRGIRKKWGIRVFSGFRNETEFRHWNRTKIADLQSRNEFYKDIGKLMEDLGLDPKFDFFFFLAYLTKGKDFATQMLKKQLPRPNVEIDSFGIKKLVIYNMTGRVTKDEWIKLWPEVKELRSFFPKNEGSRMRRMENEGLGKFTLKLKQKGLSDKQIAGEIKKKFGVLYGYDYVRKLRKRTTGKIKRDT